MVAKPTLKVVSTRPRPMPGPHPAPASLDKIGAELWVDVTTTYEFSDPGSYAILEEACLCRQRAERCRVIIDRDGELLFGKTGVRSHPLWRDELANRALCARLLSRLGLDLEPLHDRPGRPSSGK
jgi:hypothetical protein